VGTEEEMNSAMPKTGGEIWRKIITIDSRRVDAPMGESV